ncbi:hypothetical protein GCM10027591_00260 [Zhihengliuella somnathii]
MVPLGLAARYMLPGGAGDLAGGALYAVLIYLLVAFAVPRVPPSRVGAVALAICAAVEFFQLTPVPRMLAEVFPPSALVLGSSFVWMDLLAYAAGAAVAGLVDSAVRGRRRQEVPTRPGDD